MNDQLWGLIVAIGMGSLVPIFTALGKLTVQKIQLQALNIKGDQWEKTKLIVNAAIMSSEQQYKAGMIKDRKQHAIAVSQKMLSQRKLKIDDDILSEMIESQVWETLSSNEKPEPVAVVQPPMVVIPTKITGDEPEPVG